MQEPRFKDQVHRVASLWIDAPELKRDLASIASAIDNGLSDAEIVAAGNAFRDAYGRLSMHVYEHCRPFLADKTLAEKANRRFEEFESYHGGVAATTLRDLRFSSFRVIGNDASHRGEHRASKTKITDAPLGKLEAFHHHPQEYSN